MGKSHKNMGKSHKNMGKSRQLETKRKANPKSSSSSTSVNGLTTTVEESKQEEEEEEEEEEENVEVKGEEEEEEEDAKTDGINWETFVPKKNKRFNEGTCCRNILFALMRSLALIHTSWSRV